MEKLKYITTAVIILLVIFDEISAEVSVSTRSHHFPGQKCGYSSNSLENGKFVYTLCDTGEVQRKCKVVQEDILTGNISHSCDIILKIEEQGMAFGLFLQFAFGQDRAILIWEEKQGLEQNFIMYVRFTTIQFYNCLVGEAKLLDDNEALHREPIHHQLYIGEKVITSDNKYDVFFEDRTRCGNQECQLSIDDKGRIINMTLPLYNGNTADSKLSSNIPYHPTFVGNNPYHIRMLKLLSRNKQGEIFASLKMNNNEAIVTVIVPGVSEKIALTIDSEQSEIRGHSVEHEVVGICINSKNASKLTCSQYDVNGNSKSEVNLPDLESHMSSMYVLPNGGFLLLALKLEYCQSSDENCDKHPIASYYRIIKVDATGNMKELRLKGFNKTRIGQYAEFIYKNPNGEGYCTTVVYGNYILGSKYIGGKVEDRNVVTNCFTEADFTE